MPSDADRTAAIVLAGGLGTRVAATESKVYMPVADRPLLTWSLRTFEDSPSIGTVILVVRPGDTDRARRTIAEDGIRKIAAVVEGGETRHRSEHAGLEAAAPAIERGEVSLVCVHDAARPFFTAALLDRVLAAAAEHGGAIPCLPVGDPVLLRAVGGRVAEAVPTDALRRVQTPQAFRARELLAAHRHASRAGFEGIDTAEPFQRFSDGRVRAVAGETDNLKVTFAADLRTADLLARTKGQAT